MQQWVTNTPCEQQIKFKWKGTGSLCLNTKSSQNPFKILLRGLGGPYFLMLPYQAVNYSTNIVKAYTTSTCYYSKIVSHLIVTTNLESKYYYYSHLTDEETDAQRGQVAQSFSNYEKMPGNMLPKFTFVTIMRL